jgi:hypothetical protein
MSDHDWSRQIEEWMRQTHIVATSERSRDYRMTVLGSDNGAKDSVTVLFSRVASKSSQQHMYAFDTGVKVTGTSISGSFGRFGSVKLRLTNARSVKGKKGVPKGCTGTPGKAKTGTLSGRFKLAADKTYFRTVTAKKPPATAAKSGSIKCGGSGDGTGGNGGGDGGGAASGPMLTHSKQDGGATFMFTATPGAQTAIQMDDAGATAPARVIHQITATGPSLTVGGGGITATVKGQPRDVSGQGAFTGEGGAGPVVTGTLAGSLVAKFDSIGRVNIAGDATLMNR